MERDQVRGIKVRPDTVVNHRPAKALKCLSSLYGDVEEPRRVVDFRKDVVASGEAVLTCPLRRPCRHLILSHHVAAHPLHPERKTVRPALVRHRQLYMTRRTRDMSRIETRRVQCRARLRRRL